MHLLLQVMSAIINIIFTTILVVEFIIGNLLNGFIALVNCLDWVQKRQISLVDKIITALTVFRVAQLWLVKIIVLIFLIYSVKVTETMLRVTNTVWVVTNHFNLWLSTKLSIFYLLKIVNFSNSFFLYLKWRVRQVFSMSLMLSLVLLFLNIKVINTHIDVWFDVNGRNMPYNFSFMNSNSTSLLKHILSTNSIFAVIPFVMSLVAFFLLILSLWKHEKRMHHTANNSRDATIRAHIKALKTGIAFLSLYTISLISLVINIFSLDSKENSMIFLFRLFMGITFSSCHSFVLILGNTKLRQALLSVMLWLRCWPNDTECSILF